MKTTHEYPASHSVDTDWFAIDRDGHLACISSGEGGWLPADIDAGNDAHEEEIISDALSLNSTPVIKGCRRLELSERQLAALTSNYRRGMDMFSYARYYSNGIADEKSLNGMVIELRENVRFDDLFVWKERTSGDNTSVYELSVDHRHLYCRRLTFPKNSLNMDIAKGNITGESYFSDEMFYFSYCPVSEFGTEALMERDYFNPDDNEEPPIKLRLPKGFHGIKNMDISFAETDFF